jgi:hypothetical protein
MFNRTPLCRIAKRLLHVRLDALEHRIFRKSDLDALARGWQISRPRPFTRRYRDPRWDRERLASARMESP